MSETTTTTTAPPEPAPGELLEQDRELTPEQRVVQDLLERIWALPDFNGEKYPYAIADELRHASTGRLRSLLWRMLRESDASIRPWRSYLFSLLADAIWAELRARGCRGVDAGKGGEFLEGGSENSRCGHVE